MRNNKEAAIFLDRDGTIIEDRGHLKDVSDVVFFPDTFDALRKLQRRFLLFIVTNQPGVARGIISRGDVDRINTHVVTVLAKEGIEIRDVYVCPHERSDGCCCIKPKPYFLRRAAKQYHIDLSASFAIGDHPHDVQFARDAGARGIYVLSGHGRKHFGELPEHTEVVAGIAEAAEKIAAGPAKRSKRRVRQTANRLVLDLMVACDLWSRPDLGGAPRDARHVAEVLSQAGIRTYEVAGGWLECDPRPAGICEALSGRLAPPEWVEQFNCPPDSPGRILRLLAKNGIPVCEPELSLQEETS